jgi:hypothetical protein
VDVALQKRLGPLHLSLSMSNALDARNATAFGSTPGSSTFGHPIGYYPGRSISLSARLVRR